jgi:hypothetical protein
MKRIIIILIAGFWITHFSAQSLFESAPDSSTASNEQLTKLSLNGYVRGSVYGGGETYNLLCICRNCFSNGTEKGETFLKSDIRFRKGFFFGENNQLIQLKELYAGYRGEKVMCYLEIRLSIGDAVGF